MNITILSAYRSQQRNNAQIQRSKIQTTAKELAVDLGWDQNQLQFGRMPMGTKMVPRTVSGSE